MLQAEQIIQNRYQLKQRLGAASGRQTWLVEDIATSAIEDSVAPTLAIVKLLAFDAEVRWDELKLFEREAQVLKQLNHAQIPKYRDYFCIEDRTLWFGLVQEYIPGSSLKELLDRGKKFTEQEVHQIAVDILNILIYLHELNPPVLHRDIKPSNLIWGEDEQIYLVDFGAVQDRAAREGSTFTVVGTYGYAPMEQFGGRTVPASDLYALGATLIHVLTGTAPADLPQSDLRIRFSDRVSVNSSFAGWIEQLTEPSLERRFRTARQALEALQDASALTTSVASSIQPPSGSRIRLKKSSRQLEIELPQQGWRGVLSSETFVALFWSTLLFVLSSSRIFGSSSYSAYWWLFWLLGAIGIGSLPLSVFGQTCVSLNRKDFKVEWKLFGLRYWQRCGLTSDIHHIGESRAAVLFQKKPALGVNVQAGTRAFIFGAFAPPLAEVERRWLIQEIEDWLTSE
jgi:serine/threonine protein kinase